MDVDAESDLIVSAEQPDSNVPAGDRPAVGQRLQRAGCLFSFHPPPGSIYTIARFRSEWSLLATDSMPASARFCKSKMTFNIVVVVLCARTNRLADLRPLVPELLAVLPSVKQGTATFIGI